MLRSGIILPFIYRDTKKLLMIGEKKENRDLSLWDLKNVVRAAFGIYNFEFRNKKIGFNIPDELLLNYLAQRHDLTNFVIEIGQADADNTTDSSENLKLSIESATSHIDIGQPEMKSNESSNEDHSPHYSMATLSEENNAPTTPLGTVSVINEALNESPDTPNSSHKIRSHHFCDSDTTDTLTQHSLHPLINQIIPKAEHEDADMRELRDGRYEIRRQTMLHQQQMHLQQQQQQQQYTMNQTIHHSTPDPHMSTPTTHSFSNFSTQSILGNNDTIAPPTTQSQQYSPALMNRFRRRGERMSKDQKELYVKYFEENPCMLSNRRNDHLLEPHWNKLANMLNSIPQGAAKNVEEWKQTFDAWRYRVFMYTRYNSKLAGPAAQNPKNYKPLTPTDQRAYSMWTSHKSTTPQDYDKIDMFANLDDTQTDYSYS